ncbi:hypothetical protein NF556_11605 [Ornithinimicrobium faecis]|uniref:Uncharacterized protein n=1 Tax=Ornithinimicrobium faecis TaxID=2934158 RepID=A0ABY4YNN4_9MICO|nr:hypothetical protein [Ornithinimicrobium sp. HY1793]USQ78299.1 hypothetical protein NF556_11605 [Ornithinimicrobium sp. HY1793]
MSRRRKIDPLLRDMLEHPSWHIEIVCRCTGDRRVVGRVGSKNGNPPQLEGVTSVALGTGDGLRTTSAFRCGRCRRNLPVRTDARERFTVAAMRGVSEVDLVHVAAIVD